MEFRYNDNRGTCVSGAASGLPFYYCYQTLLYLGGSGQHSQSIHGACSRRLPVSLDHESHLPATELHATSLRLGCHTGSLAYSFLLQLGLLE